MARVGVVQGSRETCVTFQPSSTAASTVFAGYVSVSGHCLPPNNVTPFVHTLLELSTVFGTYILKIEDNGLQPTIGGSNMNYDENVSRN